MTTMPQRESTIAVPDDRRKQLGAFLRARRESLDPQRLGLPRVGRRRTPGLRREEVAMLADVGVTWYTWLEQGREVNPSEAVLVGVANALQCSPLETRHLFVLAGLTPPEATQGDGVRRHQPWHPPDAGQPDAAAGQHSETEL
ncbi:DNA-binding protein [Klebsiella pneumoniae]|uniref:DNA-binding protein n=1 Tax=Klebsiella pneumoniae TaxID=573 RepID=A0A509A7N9_KLEPN|nr:DNA-binding protein [Klebsiella pneumoniae]